MNKYLTLKDNLKVESNSKDSIPNLFNKIVDKDLDYLAKNENLLIFPPKDEWAKDLEKTDFILKSQNDDYFCGNVMGFLGYKDERLDIASRFGDSYFVLYMLSKVFDIPNLVSLNISSKGDSFFDLYSFLFPYYLKRAFSKGIYKTYVRREYNDSSVKGTIDIARHIKKNTPFTGDVAYSQREFSYDNYVTELIRHTIEYIKVKPYGSSILSNMKEEVRTITEITPSYRQFDRTKVLLKNKQSMITNQYFLEYRILQKLCIAILSHSKNSIGISKEEINGIIFDGAWLWEEYINTLIKDKFYHPQNKKREGRQCLFENGYGVIYPDFIGKDKEDRVIADAKYKYKENIKGDDFLQILAYMYRFESKKGYFIYPKEKENENTQLHLLSGTNYDGKNHVREDISVTKLGLYIPSGCNNYKEFEDEMSRSEAKLKEDILL